MLKFFTSVSCFKKMLFVMMAVLCCTSVYAQHTYDFSTAPVISGATPSFPWNTNANITIAGVNYLLTSGGNGSFTYSGTGGNANSACLVKPGSGGDTFSLQRADGQPFHFYGMWIKEEGINSYDGFNLGGGVVLHLPPFYTITYNKSPSGTEVYNDATPKGGGTYTTFATTISKDVMVTSVSIYFQANSTYWIDDIIVSSPDETGTATLTTSASSLAAFTTCAGTAPAAKSFTVSGTGLTANLALAAPAGYEISSTSATSGYTTGSLSLPPSGGTVASTTIYARLTSSATGSPSGNITISSTGATSKTVALSGTVTALPATPTISAGGSTTFCTGGSVQLNSSSATGNQWYLNGGIITGATNQSYTTSSSGTYSVVVTNGGCSSAVSAGTVVTVNPLPTISLGTVTAVSTSATSFSIPYTANLGGATYAISTTGTVMPGFTAVSNQTLTGSPLTVTIPASTANTYNFTFTVKSSSGCTTAYPFSLTVNDPVITFSSALTSLSTTYGAASGQQSFTVSGTNLGAGITAQAPGGFEVSTDNSTYAASVTIPQSGGIITSVPVYIRLAANATAGNHAGNVTLSSAGATSKTVATNATNNVAQRALTITANNQTKVYGAALPTLTASYNGFVNGETAANLTTLPTLSTTATAASSVAGGPYAITASGAVNANYSISYVPGILTVTPALLTITANNQTKVYGAAIPTLAASYTGLVNGDIAASLTTPPTLSTMATAASSVAGSPYTITASGAVSSNYIISYVAGSLTVTQAPLTITANNQTKAYGAALPTLTASYSGLVNGDTPASLATPPTLSTTATVASSVAGSPYAITASGAVSNNYVISYVAGNLAVTPVALTITADNQTKVYGAALPTLTASYTGLVNGDTPAGLTTPPTLSTTATAASSVAGSPYAITASGAVNINYTISYVPGTLTVTPAPLTITANNQTKVYGAALPALTASYNGLLNGDTPASLTTAPTLSTTATAVSSVAGSPYAITASGAVDANYSINYAAGLLTVTTAPITVTANAKTKNYGDADPALDYTYTGTLITGDAFTGALSRTPGENVGVYTIGQGNLALSANYALTYASQNLTISQRALSITATGPAKLFGTALIAGPSTANFTVNGLQNSETVTTVTLTPDAAGLSATTPAGANYVVTPSAATGANGFLTSNYNIAYTPFTGTVGTASQTITFDSLAGVTYGQTPITLTGSASSGLAITYNSSNPAVATVSGNVLTVVGAGSTTITASQAGNSNYNAATAVPQTFTVSAKAITVTADVKSKIYGAIDPALTYQITTGALVGADAFTGALTRDAGENIGAYAIKQGTLALSTNYNLTYVGANLTIGAKAITVTADAKSKTYGATDPALTYQITTGALVGADAFTGALTRDAGENIGAYAIKQGTLALSTNYNLTYVGANLTIGAKAITVTADAKSKTYGATDPALTYQITTGALVGADAFTGALTRDAGENIGAYAIKQGTLALSTNYNLTYVGANLTIGAKAITVTADAKSKIYGATDPALTYQITTGALVGSDAFTGALTRDAGENIGAYVIKQGTLALNTNYTLTYAGANLTIGAKAIAITADAKIKTYGSADPALTYQITTGALVGADTFTGALTRDAGENAGAYAITKGTLTLNANYALTYTGAQLTIGKKVLTVTADNKTKVYGAANPPLTITYSGFAGTDNAGSLTTAAVATTTANTASPVNTYPVNAAGAASNNYSFNYVAGTLQVTPAALTIAADNKTKIFGTTNPPLTASYSGFVNGDNSNNLTTQPTLSTTATTASAIGNYPIVANNAVSNNYIISYVAGVLTVNNATLTITADSKSKIYGAANPALTVSYSGFVNGDTEAGLTTRPTISTTATAASAVNTYPVTATGAVIPNYTIVYVPGTLTVNKAMLTVTADDKSRNFGVANPALTIVYSGFVNGDDATKLTTAPVPATTATSTTAPGTYNITVSGGVSANYNFNYVSGKLTIIPLTNSIVNSLTISDGVLTPAFASGIFSYKVSVPNSVVNLRLTPGFDPTATSSINGSSTANGTTSSAIPLNVGDNTITLLVTAQDGTTKSTYTINVYRGAAPISISATNILTPNGDGKNDYWVIQDILLYPNNIVSIYDKAGRTIYSKRGYTNDWDGTLKGAPLDQGTYYYTVDLGAGFPKFRGYITILKSH